MVFKAVDFKMGLVHLPTELLEFIFDHALRPLPVNWNYFQWELVLNMRLVCSKSFIWPCLPFFCFTSDSSFSELFDNITLHYIFRKVKLDAKNVDSVPALSWAAWMGHEAIVQLLLERKVDANEKNNRKTPLHRAAARGHETVVRLLLEHKTDVNRGYYPSLSRMADVSRSYCDMAAVNGHRTVVRLLLKYNADVNQDCSGPTALYMAAENQLRMGMRR